MYTIAYPTQANGVKIIPVAFQTELGVATFAGTMQADIPGLLLDYAFKFDGTNPPDSLTFAMTDLQGFHLAGATITASSTARDNLGASTPVDGVKMTLSGNTTNDAKGTLYLYFLG